MQTILVTDDDREIADLVAVYLTNDGYNVMKAHDGPGCLAALERGGIDLVLLDVMMPGMDGVETCRRIREDANIPVIIVSAKDQPMDVVLLLSTGADDYIVKPFHPVELMARVKAQLRRAGMASLPVADGRIALHDISIDKAAHTVARGEELIPLTPKEFGILLLLAEHRGQVLTTEQIFTQVWGENAFNQDNTVMVHIRKIREKLRDERKNPRYIKTVWGVGYRCEKD